MELLEQHIFMCHTRRKVFTQRTLVCLKFVEKFSSKNIGLLEVRWKVFLKEHWYVWRSLKSFSQRILVCLIIVEKFVMCHTWQKVFLENKVCFFKACLKFSENFGLCKVRWIHAAKGCSHVEVRLQFVWSSCEVRLKFVWSSFEVRLQLAWSLFEVSFQFVEYIPKSFFSYKSSFKVYLKFVESSFEVCWILTETFFSHKS